MQMRPRGAGELLIEGRAMLKERKEVIEIEEIFNDDENVMEEIRDTLRN